MLLTVRASRTPVVRMGLGALLCRRDAPLSFGGGHKGAAALRAGLRVRARPLLLPLVAPALLLALPCRARALRETTQHTYVPTQALPRCSLVCLQRRHGGMALLTSSGFAYGHTT